MVADILYADVTFQFLIENLQDIGYENLAIDSDRKDTLLIYYENRIFRDEMLGLAVVAVLSSNVYPEKETIILCPQNRGIVLCNISMSNFLLTMYLKQEISETLFSSSLQFVNVQKSRNSQTWNDTNYKLDIKLSPGTMFRLGNYDDAFKYTGSLMYDASISFWPGNMVNIRYNIPMINELKVYTYEPRIVRGTVSQVLRINRDALFSFSCGSFETDRWGFSGEIFHSFLNREIYSGFSMDYTGFLLYQNNKWIYSKVETWTWKGYTRYNFSKIDATLELCIAKFIKGDQGFLIELDRYFNELQIGFYAAFTDVDKFGGLQMRIPFAPLKRSPPKTIRFGPEKYASLNYRSTSLAHTFGAPTETGMKVHHGNDLVHYQKSLRPGYFYNNLDVFKQATRIVYEYLGKK